MLGPWLRLRLRYVEKRIYSLGRGEYVAFLKELKIGLKWRMENRT